MTDAGTRYDLSELAAAEARNLDHLFGRFLAWVGVGLRVAIAFEGIYLGFVQLASHNSLSPAEAIALVLTGVLLIASGVWYQGSDGRAPTYLVVSQEGMTVGRAGSAKRTVVRWNDPRINIDLFDRSGVPAPKNPSRSKSVYSVIPGNNQSVSLPEPAFKEILRQAERHTLTVKRNVYSSNVRAWGTVVILSLGPPLPT